MSDQHKTVEETVPLTMDMIRLKSGDYPVINSEPVHVRAEHIKGKELVITANTDSEIARRVTDAWRMSDMTL